MLCYYVMIEDYVEYRLIQLCSYSSTYTKLCYDVLATLLYLY